MTARECAIHDMRLSEVNIITDSNKQIEEYLINNEIETEVAL